jgi:molecular chaperone GrpE
MEQEKDMIIQPRAEGAEEGEKNNLQAGPSSGVEVAASGAPAPSTLAEMAAAYEKLQAEKKELYDRLLRKQAELENVRKRTQREKEEFRQHATEELIRALLPTLDSFDRALKHHDADVPESVYQGMELIYRELLGVLERAGLVAIETQGKLFDPRLHQAVETVELSDRDDQEIVEELQRGYQLKHRLLRPAIVKVALARQGKFPDAFRANS